jgi:hypothetical protein
MLHSRPHTLIHLLAAGALLACDAAAPSADTTSPSTPAGEGGLEGEGGAGVPDAALADAATPDAQALDVALPDLSPPCALGDPLGCASPLHALVCGEGGVAEVQGCPSSTRCERDLCRVISCVSDSDCQDDTFCAQGSCAAYPGPGRGASNDRCALSLGAEAFAPEVQCRWAGGEVSGQPLVIDLHRDGVPEVLVVVGGNAVALSGETCEEVGRSVGLLLSNESSMAAGDIDGDGQVEVVAMGGFGAVTALKADLTLKWSALTPTVGLASAPAIADLDADGLPEVIVGGTALNGEDGSLHGRAAEEPPAHGFGPIPAVADVDQDGRQEVIYGNRLLNSRMEDITPPAMRALAPGHVAVADFDPSTPEPELAVVTGVSRVRVQRLSGEVIFGPYAVPGSMWAGGAPNVADFDGDGRPEVGTAGSHFYAVFDLECVGDPLPPACEAEGIRWTKASRDTSSGSTGSTTFDFDGDGRVEVVYNDECFLRVYDGATGEVRLALANTTGTLIEAPIVADADGDDRSEIVVGSDRGFPCEAPDPHTGTPPRQTRGVVVLRDASERWVRSRPIWNQNAYSITHVEEDGAIPPRPEPSWRRLNSFRQNAQPDGKALEAPDLTARGHLARSAACDPPLSATPLSATVYNRGAQPVSRGVRVGFYANDPTLDPSGDPPAPLCEATTPARLSPGEGVEVSCEWAGAPAEGAVVWVRVDPPSDPALPAGGRAECVEGNNLSVTLLTPCE